MICKYSIIEHIILYRMTLLLGSYYYYFFYLFMNIFMQTFKFLHEGFCFFECSINPLLTILLLRMNIQLNTSLNLIS